MCPAGNRPAKAEPHKPRFGYLRFGVFNCETLGKMGKEYKLGIALGGGGARGFAHLGVLKALQEKGYEPDVISGVSAGALAGAFLASDYSPDEAMEIMSKNGFTDFASLIVPKNGLLSLSKMEKVLGKHLGEKRIEDLPKPFIVTVTNLLSGRPEYITKGDLVPFVVASSSIPVLFSPVEIGGKYYVDGGLMDNLPIAPLEDCCDEIIAVSISPIQEIEELSGLIDVATRTFQLSVNNQLNGQHDACDLFIEPKGLTDYSLLDADNAQELFDLGYRHVMEEVEAR